MKFTWNESTENEKYQKAEDQALPNPGDYLVEVLSCREKISKNGAGNPYFNLHLKILDPKIKDTSFWAIVMPTGKMNFKFKHFFLACGMQEEFERNEIHEDEVVGRTCIATVSHGEYNGKPKLEAEDFKEEPFDNTIPF